jgi:hypothetical protein
MEGYEANIDAITLVMPLVVSVASSKGCRNVTRGPRFGAIPQLPWSVPRPGGIREYYGNIVALLAVV